LLLLDVSGSMRGSPINQLNEGLAQFRDELFADSLAAKRVEVGLVTFGPIQVVNDFTSVQNWVAPTLSARGDTPMGAAVEQGLTVLRSRKDIYKSNGISYYRPWVFIRHAATQLSFAAASDVQLVGHSRELVCGENCVLAPRTASEVHEFDMWMACATCAIFIPIPPSSAQSESRRGPCCVLRFDRARDAK
jgi:hypothetical protein